MFDSVRNSANATTGNTQKVQKVALRKPISVSVAAARAEVTPETIIRWCRCDKIGKQKRPKAPWRVDPLGLAIEIAGDGEALAAYQADDWDHPALGRFLNAL